MMRSRQFRAALREQLDDPKLRQMLLQVGEVPRGGREPGGIPADPKIKAFLFKLAAAIDNERRV